MDDINENELPGEEVESPEMVEEEGEEQYSPIADLEADKNTKKRLLQEDALASLASELTTTLLEYISDKAPIEQRMLADYAQYHGSQYTGVEEKFNESNMTVDPNRSTVVVNVTRSKADSGIARVSNMLFPTDDRNWDIQPTPVPELAQMLQNKQPLQMAGQDVMKPAAEGQEPQPMTEADLAVAEMEDAQDRANRMRKEIDDQLEECKYAIEARKSIRDAGILGTGILKGPMQIGKVRKAWVPHRGKDGQVIHALKIQEVVKPYIYRVSPWNFFPDMSVSDIRDAEKTFELHYKTAQQMREYLRTPGFMKTQVKKVLEMGPGVSKIRDNSIYMAQMRAIAGLANSLMDDNRYQVAEYHGPVSKHILEMMGMDVDPDECLEEYQAFVWFCGGVVIKFALHHLDSEDKLYSIVNWIKDDASVFGYGIPFSLRTPQRVITAAWRMVLDNAGLSSGPQIVINREAVTPADGSWELSNRKIWYVDDEEIDIRQAFATFNIDSHQQELMNIYYEGKRLADEESSLPMIAQGMAGTTGRTASGMNMAMNAANTTPMQFVRNFDDDITIPILGRTYDWNMQFNPKEDIKGDYEIRALGSSALLVKDMQSQGLLAIMQYTGHPTFGPLIKGAKLLRMAVSSMKINPDDVVKDDVTIKKEEDDARAAAEQAGPQITPDVQAKIDAQLQIAQLNSDDKEKALQAKLIQVQTEADKLLAQLASNEQITQEQARLKYNIHINEMDLDAQKFYDELEFKATTGKPGL